MREKQHAISFLYYSLVVVCGLVVAMPFVWMIISSLKTESELLQAPPSFFPEEPTFSSYASVIRDVPFISYYAHTIIITILRTIAQVLFCSLSAFAFAKMHFKGKNFVFVLLLSVLMVPHQMILVPDYIIMRHLGLLDTLLGVALPGMFSAFGMFLLRQFYLSLPNEYMEAGRIDGCTFYGVFHRLYLPLTTSAIMSLIIFTVMYSWNDYLWPLICSASDRSKVLSVGISLLQGANRVYYNEIMAGAAMSTLPIIFIFVCFQKYFIQGIALSGVKG